MSEFSKRLVAWQRREGRNELPWSGSREPYRVWLSEVMLQQTQVATVRAAYARFLERWPTVQSLAAATLDEVLAQWAGLGYYSRARNLHACAQAVAALGNWPRSAAELEQLPGIGRSTARAIAAFCFDERLSIFDGNVRRLMSRLLAFDADLASTKAQRELWAQADTLVPAAADMPAYTQGLMDLGATVCTPRKPNCAACPMESLCEGKARAAELPRVTKKLKRGRREHWWLWLQREADGALWLQQRPTPGVWAGLWSLPLFEQETELARFGTTEPLPRVEHALTHFDWVLHPRRAPWTSAEAPMPEGRWVVREELSAYGLPAPLKKVAGLMDARVLPQGEQALLLQIGAVDAAPDIATQRRLLDLVRAWQAQPGVIELVPGIHNLQLRLDPLRADTCALRRQLLAAWAAAEPREAAGRLHELTVRYEGEDLGAVAAHAGLSEQEVIALHASAIYEVACLGFQPGFAYLMGLPAALQMPRLDQPRLRVPAGSLAIGGALCGVYPQASPGGWRLIGHCGTPLFDTEPLLRPGDRVRFHPHA